MRTAVFTLALAWQALSPEIQQHVKAGMAARQAGNLPQAIAEFRKVAELAPQLAAAHVNLADAYIRSGNHAAAIDPLKQALKLNPDLIGATQMLGAALLTAGYASEAIPHLEKSKSEDLLGIAYFKAGRLQEAIPALQATLAKRPGDPDLLYYFGRATGLLSKQIFESLDTTQPDSARAHQMRGDSYAALRNTAAAEKEYREALRLRPNTPEIHFALGELHAASGQWEQAAAEYRAEFELQPGDAESAYRLGNALLQLGKIKDARATLDRANTLAPSMPETLFAMGKSAYLDGDTKAAEKAWLDLLGIEKDSTLAGQAHFSLAALYRKQGDTAKAEASMREFQRIQPASRRPTTP